MKKVLALLLVILLCFSIFSCKKDETDTPDDQKDTSVTEKGTIDDENEDEYTPSKDDDNSMFVYPEDPGQYVVDYIYKMATLKWTPKQTFQLYGKYQAWSYNLTYERAQTYYGPPFLVDSRGSMQEFVGSLEDGVYVGGTTATDCIGDACYDAVFVSLIQVCPSISFKSTEDMLPKNNTGLIALGDWNENITKHDTPQILYASSSQTMAKSYALLKPGDVVLKHVVVQDAGHARIVSEAPTIVYTETNNIDISKSYIKTIEQTNLWDDTTDIKTTWWVNRTYTFGDLINNNFVPLRPIDYVEKPKDAYVASEGLITADEIFEAKKLKGTVFSNHYITELEISITNESGAEIYNQKVYPNAKKVYLEDIKYAPKLYKFNNGTYNFKIKASLAFGTKTLADYSFDIKY